jgi:hypothetical protein
VKPLLGALFRFLRYDIRLECKWLREVLDLSVGADTLRQARGMDDSWSMLFLEEIGEGLRGCRFSPSIGRDGGRRSAGAWLAGRSGREPTRIEREKSGSVAPERPVPFLKSENSRFPAIAN